MQVLRQAFEVSQEVHKLPVDVLNAQPTWELKLQGLAADVLELYPIQEQSFVQIEASVLVQDSLVEQLHRGLSVSLQSILRAPQIVLATWSVNFNFITS